ncbi:hypothetical protein TNCT_305391 [Trichonephila clavata]|uniref:Uncharacterized protein n=1 Tax=Trichonephila clavata TaxID=2740835 RepID=A0A8X6F7M3_TRICU|nr:hypothetical protein TNCT_305391 [Trichonephila clavata]
MRIFLTDAKFTARSGAGNNENVCENKTEAVLEYHVLVELLSADSQMQKDIRYSSRDPLNIRFSKRMVLPDFNASPPDMSMPILFRCGYPLHFGLFYYVFHFFLLLIFARL